MIIDEVNSSDLSSAVTEDDRKKTRDGISLVSDSEREKLIGQVGKLFIIAGNNLTVQRGMCLFAGAQTLRYWTFRRCTRRTKIRYRREISNRSICSHCNRTYPERYYHDMHRSIWRNKVDNALSIAVAEDSTQPVDKNKDYCTVCQQHLSATIEDIINIKL